MGALAALIVATAAANHSPGVQGAFSNLEGTIGIRHTAGGHGEPNRERGVSLARSV